MGLGAGFDTGTIFPIDEGVGLGDNEEAEEGADDNKRCSLHKLNRSKILLGSENNTTGDAERLDNAVGDIVVGEDTGEGSGKLIADGVGFTGNMQFKINDGTVGLDTGLVDGA